MPNGSGMAEVVPFVASEKNVDAWVVSMLRESVYDAWNDSPFALCRRSSRMPALYQESPSLVLASTVLNAVFGRAAVTG